MLQVAELGAMQDSLGVSSELSQRVKGLRAAACQYTSLSNDERKQLAENLRCMVSSTLLMRKANKTISKEELVTYKPRVRGIEESCFEYTEY